MLQLRKLVQEPLIEAGLKDLFIQRVDNYGNFAGSPGTIVICGPCGLPLIFIPEIVVPARLNDKEREIAFELITKYLKNHGDDVDELWSLKKNRINLKHFDSIYNLSRKNYGNTDEIGLNDDEMNLSFIMNLKNHKYFYRTHDANLHQIKAMTAKHDEYVKVIQNYNDLRIKMEEQDQRIAELTTCKI